jgi:hypothetical protein
LREKPTADITVVEQAVQLLETLPDSMTDEERASLLIPIDSGDLVPLPTGVCYQGGGINFDGGRMNTAHHLISEKLAEKIGIKPTLLDDAEGSIDLGGKPITIIRNTLRQYEPTQFFTEFIANASDAGAKRFSILIDDQEGPGEHLLSKGLAVFQTASLVVHNDGIFSPKDFRGILQTGIGGKRGRTSVIGHFGLGALSMFHFTEVRSSVADIPKANTPYPVCHDCFRGSRPFHEPFRAQLIILRETFASSTLTKCEKVRAVKRSSFPF